MGEAANERMSTTSASAVIDHMRSFLREFKYAQGVYEGLTLIRQVIDTGKQLSG